MDVVLEDDPIPSRRNHVEGASGIGAARSAARNDAGRALANLKRIKKGIEMLSFIFITFNRPAVC